MTAPRRPVATQRWDGTGAVPGIAPGPPDAGDSLAAGTAPGACPAVGWAVLEPGAGVGADPGAVSGILAAAPTPSMTLVGVATRRSDFIAIPSVAQKNTVAKPPVVRLM